MGVAQCKEGSQFLRGNCGTEIVEVCTLANFQQRSANRPQPRECAEWVSIQCQGDFAEGHHGSIGSVDKAILNQHLLVAAREGKENDVASLLERRAFVDTRRPFVMSPDATSPPVMSHDTDVGMTPLMYAAQSGHVRTCQVLLKHEAHVNAREEDGMRPLHFAALSGDVEVVEALVAAGADVGARTDDMHEAIDIFDVSRLSVIDRKRLQLLLTSAQEGTLEANAGATEWRECAKQSESIRP
mmetsp:Transcript_42885/g.100636  ORF Transcript_42885/g.100636 Transcript_42885/m.100636 type:complete len:242 (+) Transcript_42885:111-836(+)